MYGLINKALEGFIVELAGIQAWHAIKNKAKCNIDEFIAMSPYPDKITFSLVNAACEHLETPATDILRGFGRHWILYTGNEGYAGLLDFYGNNIEEFITNLDDMHSRVQMSMPELKMPQFSCHRSDKGDLVVDYISERAGLEAMVEGLLTGLGERYNQPIVVTQAKAPTNVNARFTVHFLEKSQAA